jgi:hypothetical protein
MEKRTGWVLAKSLCAKPLQTRRVDAPLDLVKWRSLWYKSNHG